MRRRSRLAAALLSSAAVAALAAATTSTVPASAGATTESSAPDGPAGLRPLPVPRRTLAVSEDRTRIVVGSSRAVCVHVAGSDEVEPFCRRAEASLLSYVARFSPDGSKVLLYPALVSSRPRPSWILDVARRTATEIRFATGDSNEGQAPAISVPRTDVNGSLVTTTTTRPRAVTRRGPAPILFGGWVSANEVIAVGERQLSSIDADSGRATVIDRMTARPRQAVFRGERVAIMLTRVDSDQVVVYDARTKQRQQTELNDPPWDEAPTTTTRPGARPRSIPMAMLLDLSIDGKKALIGWNDVFQRRPGPLQLVDLTNGAARELPVAPADQRRPVMAAGFNHDDSMAILGVVLRRGGSAASRLSAVSLSDDAAAPIELGSVGFPSYTALRWGADGIVVPVVRNGGVVPFSVSLPGKTTPATLPSFPSSIPGPTPGTGDTTPGTDRPRPTVVATPGYSLAPLDLPASPFAVSADGRLVGHTDDGRVCVSQVRTAAGETTTVAPAPREPWCAEVRLRALGLTGWFSPDGTKLFVSPGVRFADRQSSWILDLTTRRAVEVKAAPGTVPDPGPPPGALVFDAVWLDGARVAIIGPQRIDIVDASTGAASPMPKPVELPRNMRWAVARGERVAILGTDRERSPQLVLVDLATGASSTVRLTIPATMTPIRPGGTTKDTATKDTATKDTATKDTGATSSSSTVPRRPRSANPILLGLTKDAKRVLVSWTDPVFFRSGPVQLIDVASGEANDLPLDPENRMFIAGGFSPDDSMVIVSVLELRTGRGADTIVALPSDDPRATPAVVGSLPIGVYGPIRWTESGVISAISNRRGETAAWRIEVPTLRA